MPQFVPPPLIPDPDEEKWVAPDSGMTRDERYEFETSRPIVDLPKLQRMAREGSVPDSCRRTFWMLLLGTTPTMKSQRPAAHRKMLEDYEGLVRDLLSGMSEVPLPLDDDPRRIDVDIPRTMPTLHFFGSHEGSPSCAAERERQFSEQQLSTSDAAVGSPATASDDASPTADGSQSTPAADGAAAADPSASKSGTVSESPFSPNQRALRRILHLFAHLNAGAGYVQGMNELVGHLMYAFSAGRGNATPQLEADVFFSFQHMHQFVGDNFQRELDLDATGVKGTMTAFSMLLLRVDNPLFQALEKLGMAPEYYAFRWVTLMFSQDFTTPDVLTLWDFLLSYRDDLDAVVIFVAVAMVTLVRDRVMEGNFGVVIQMLQSYPPDVDIRSITHRAMELIADHGMDAARDGRGEVRSRPTSRPATPPAEPSTAAGAEASGSEDPASKKGGGIRAFFGGLASKLKK